MVSLSSRLFATSCTSIDATSIAIRCFASFKKKLQLGIFFTYGTANPRGKNKINNNKDGKKKKKKKRINNSSNGETLFFFYENIFNSKTTKKKIISTESII